jgi:hypothetical protein
MKNVKQRFYRGIFPICACPASWLLHPPLAENVIIKPMHPACQDNGCGCATQWLEINNNQHLRTLAVTIFMYLRYCLHLPCTKSNI